MTKTNENNKERIKFPRETYTKQEEKRNLNKKNRRKILKFLES